MSYAVKADLMPRRLSLQELIELTDDAVSGAVDDTIVTDILTEASAMVDSYVRIRYITPLQPSEQIKGLTLDIAEYMLFSRRRRVPQAITDRYGVAIKFLQDVSKQLASLDQPSGANPQLGGGPSVPTKKDEKFSDDNLAGYV